MWSPEKAMNRLNKLPKLDPSVWDKQDVQRMSGDQRRTPFKGAQSASAGTLGHLLIDSMAEKYGSYNAALSHGKVKRVSLASLRGLQAGVDAGKVAQKIRDLTESDEIDAASVARYKGKQYLIDGNHTLTALKLGGVRSVEAIVVNVLINMRRTR